MLSIHHTLDYSCKIAVLYLHKLGVQHPFCIQTKQTYITTNPTYFKRLARKYLNKVKYLDPLHELEL